MYIHSEILAKVMDHEEIHVGLEHVNEEHKNDHSEFTQRVFKNKYNCEKFKFTKKWRKVIKLQIKYHAFTMPYLS